MLNIAFAPLASSTQDQTSSEDWPEVLAQRALELGLVVAGALLVWLLGRLLIRVLTRSISSGLPLSRRARAAIRKAGLAPDASDPQAARLMLDRRAQRAGTIAAVLNSTLAAVLSVVVLVMILDIAGLPVAPLLASAGIVGVALGFGAQSLVKDVLAGLFILLEDQYGVGDVVDLGEATGAVEEVGLRVTRLRSLDGTVWFVPNGEIVRVGNMTKVFSRAVIEVRLDYSTDLDEARRALADALAAARAAQPEIDAAIMAEPDIPGIEAFDYDAVVIRLIVQVTPLAQWNVARAVRRELRDIFAERGIRIAVPDHTLYLDQTHPAKRGAEGGEDTTLSHDKKPQPSSKRPRS